MLLGMAAAPLLAGCPARTLQAPTPSPTVSLKQTFPQSLNQKLDLLFMIDDSSSMQSLQTKLSTNLPTLLNLLKALPTGLPDLHIAVVSSSMGYDSLNITGCRPQDVDNGVFRHTIDPTGTLGTTCAGVTLNGNYISAEANAAPNFTGDIGTVFGCIALLGQSGCGFEAQMASVQAALDPNNPIPDNAGFLRDDAILGVVMLTNEDDCSAPPDTGLFDDPQGGPDDALGRLMSYRCTEFGILCDSISPPHTLDPNTTVTLNNCVSAEGSGMLTTVASFESFLLSLKGGDASRVLFAAITAPPTPFQVSSYQSLSSPPNPTYPTAPGLVPACMNQTTMEYGDPAVRITKAATDLGGTTYDICAGDFAPAMTQIAADIGRRLGPACINGTIATRADGTPDCSINDVSRANDGTTTQSDGIPFCNTTAAPFPSPCWQLITDATRCPNGQVLQICRDPTCNPNQYPTGSVSASVQCELVAP
jgi:hypothetical protein